MVAVPAGYAVRMSEQQNDDLGRLDDEQEEAQVSDTTDGPAAEGEYDPAQGSPDSGPHAPAEPDTEV